MRILHNTFIIALVVCSACSSKSTKESVTTTDNITEPILDESVDLKEETSEHQADTLSDAENGKKSADLIPKTVKDNRQEKLTTPIEQVNGKKDTLIKEESDENIETKEIITRDARNQIDHSVWNDLMKEYVTNDGKVNYKQLKNHQAKIKSYMAELAGTDGLQDLSKNVQLAFWINLYNAVTVNLILDNYPLKSVMDINGGKAWDLKLVTLEDRTLSLNDIEHNIIRKQFKEPRIHFAVNCAAKSCPKLLNSAFSPETLDRQLEVQTSYFINNKSKNKISSEQLALSKIFDWYGSDFGDVKTFIQKYEPAINMSQEISFAEYDWSLNE